MATALFIKRADLVKNTALNANVDTDKFIQFIKIAQEITLEIMCTDLYNKISADIIAGTLFWRLFRFSKRLHTAYAYSLCYD